MPSKEAVDCIIVGYNDLPFEKYVELLSQYGRNSEAFRDLKFSFVDLNGKPLNYVSLLNHVVKRAHPEIGDGAGLGPFKSGEIPNLAAVYLSNFLRKFGIRTKYINLFQDEKDKFAELLQAKPACVAITTTFYVLNFPVNEIVQFVREHSPQTKIVVGGPLISNHLRNLQGGALDSALMDMAADFYVVDSQGEGTLATLVKTVKHNLNPGEVPNLAYFDHGRLVRTPVVPEVNVMDEVDIHWDEFSLEEDLGETIQLRTARSCAFKCAFCNYPARAGKLSLSSLDTVERELSSIRSLENVSNVVFIDDTFNVPLPRFKDLCRLMIKKQYNFNWFSYFRCSNSDEEAFDLMAESGCKGVFLGIESGSPSILKNMNKAATIERYAEGIKMLKERNITTFGSFILGFPGETDQTVEETIDFIRTNKPDFYRTQMWYNEPGTPIHLEKDKYQIKGEGFVWEHASMTSLEAMDHIDRMFLTIKESVWLPQWSFDFWFIPYALGKGISIPDFKKFVSYANQMLAMEIAYCDADGKSRMQKKHLNEMVTLAKKWPIRAQVAAVAVGQ
jgi:radical SAM PhpK family P-methyltransferase